MANQTWSMLGKLYTGGMYVIYVDSVIAFELS